MPVAITSPQHSSQCASVIVRCDYDTTCPRCALINKIVHLRRKRLSLGCSMSEQMSAESAAQAIIARYSLAHAECVDRVYNKEQAIAKGERPMPRKRSAMSRAQFKAEAHNKGFTVYQDEGVIIQDI
jgi:hypothetical protein